MAEPRELPNSHQEICLDTHTLRFTSRKPEPGQLLSQNHMLRQPPSAHPQEIGPQEALGNQLFTVCIQVEPGGMK